MAFAGGVAPPDGEPSALAGWSEIAQRTRFFAGSTLPFDSSLPSAAAPIELTAELFGGETVTYQLDRFYASQNASRSWVGSPIVAADPAARLVVTINQSASGTDVMTASVWGLDGARYEVFPVEETTYAMVELDVAALPEHVEDGPAPTAESSPQAPGGEDASTAETEPPIVGALPGATTIDVMVAYTPQALSRFGSATAIQTAITNDITLTNQALADSGALIDLRLVDIRPTPTNDDATLQSRDLEDLQRSGDGRFDELHTVRASVNADLVQLWTGSERGACGWGWVPPTTAGLPAYAFSTIAATPGCRSIHVTPHELGHNLSGRHNYENASDAGQNAPYSYNYGWWVNGQFRTIMSYADPCSLGCPVVLRFSTPARTWGGAPTGTSTRDNVRSFNNMRAVIAGYETAAAYDARFDQYLDYQGDGGDGDQMFSYGIEGDVQLYCDWNGDGIDTVGVRRGNAFYLRNVNSSGNANLAFSFGTSTDRAVCGDWNGDGIDTIGVYRPSNQNWYLRDANTTGAATYEFHYGIAGDVGFVGDWDGNGTDTPGIRRDNAWHLRNSNSSGSASATFSYGDVADEALPADWDGDGDDNPGVVRGNVFLLRMTNSSGVADRTVGFGIPTDLVAKGRFVNATTRDGLAVGRYVAT